MRKSDKTPFITRLRQGIHMFLSCIAEEHYIYSDNDISMVSATREEVIRYQSSITTMCNNFIEQENTLTEAKKILNQ